ncbi:MAG: GIY-YIG nuclease family protein [Chloroflexota bacterium]|nr:GIY-YIG nuclease family protein [Chloroflexota bacterium]
MWHVYVLRSLKNGRLYIGSTNDLERRTREHNSGKSRYTRSTRPFELVYQEDFGERIEARRRELFLKSGKGREFLRRGPLAQ